MKHILVQKLRLNQLNWFKEVIIEHILCNSESIGGPDTIVQKNEL